jgi:uridine kinase
MAFGNPNMMDKYFELYTNLDTLIEKYGTVNETLLYYFLLEKTIPYKLIDLNYIIILSSFNVIAITGDSGSGKTTISNIIKKLFNDSFLLECDRYHKWERGNYNWNEYTHLNPDANYITKMNQDVFDLKIGNNIYQVDYDHKTGKFTDKEFIESKENVIVCGLHSLYLSENMLNLKIYMDTDDNLRIPFKIKRDVIKRGYSIETIYKQIKAREDDYKKYICPQKNLADIVISLYTDKEFSIETYDMDEELPVYLKIGINKKKCLENIIRGLKLEKIEVEEPFYYLFFNKDYNYEVIIKTLLMNYHSNK